MTTPFLLYHKIDVPTPDVKIRGAYTAPRRFEKQIVWLRRAGIEIVPASELVDAFRRDGRFPPRKVSLTFDDGWKDFYTNAFPILRRHGVTATVFLVTSVIGCNTDIVTADGEGPREHVSESDIREMAAAGIEFGSHSVTHSHLNKLSAEAVRDEMTRSRDLIEAITQTSCQLFSYPAGFFSDDARGAAAQIGFTAAFTTDYGPEAQPDLYALNRCEILRRDRLPFHFGPKVRAALDL